jgi:protein O-GlcNAc transferase
MSDRCVPSDSVLPLDAVLHTKGKDWMEFMLPRGRVPDGLLTAFEAVLVHDRVRAENALDDGCVQAVRVAVEQHPMYRDVMVFMLGLSFKRIGRFKEAEHWFTQIPEERANALMLNELAGLYQDTGQFTLELQTREVTLRKDPQNLCARANYGIDMVVIRQYDQARMIFAHLAQDPNVSAEIHSSVLYYLHSFPDLDPNWLYAQHLHWGRIHAPAELIRIPHVGNRDRDRRLRIGYLSPNFCRHSVAANFEPFLQGRDRAAVQVIGYGNVSAPDSVTDHLKGLFDDYRDVLNMSDSDLARLIRQDEIDILVPIGGHVSGNRLTALATKPAPIIVDYGAIDTCGMDQIDYRLTDCLVDPPERQAHYRERFAYLENGMVCHVPPAHAPQVGPLPYERNGRITFAAFNAHIKMNEETLNQWAAILHQVPDARLIIKCPSATDAWLQDHYTGQFQARGIGSERLSLYGTLPDDVYLDLYNEVDIALDTYPYNGCLTTLECLWMGVPVISRIGTCHVSRVGLDILSRLALDYFACDTWEAYVKKAAVLASQVKALATLRGSLRQRMKDSPLCDVQCYCRDVEAAYRMMWHRYCQADCSANTIGAPCR